MRCRFLLRHLAVDVWRTHVVPRTPSLDRAGLAGNVLLESAATGLPRDSVAVPLGLELVDRSWLTDFLNGQGRTVAWQT